MSVAYNCLQLVRSAYIRGKMPELANCKLGVKAYIKPWI